MKSTDDFNRKWNPSYVPPLTPEAKLVAIKAMQEDEIKHDVDWVIAGIVAEVNAEPRSTPADIAAGKNGDDDFAAMVRECWWKRKKMAPHRDYLANIKQRIEEGRA